MSDFNACPCLFVGACSYACACVYKEMPGGCVRCAKHGNAGQQRAMAETISRILDWDTQIEYHHFKYLTGMWYRETGGQSNPDIIIKNKWLKEIFKLDGKIAVPFIVEEIKHHRGHWYEALRYFLKQEPEIPEESRGRIGEMNNIWIEFVKELGYI